MNKPAASGELVGRIWPGGEPSRVVVEGGRIARVEASAQAVGEVWITPGFCDIQTNGRWGISYSSPSLTIEDVIRVVLAQAELGTSRLLPTLITASFEATRHGVETIARACVEDEQVGRMVVGIHLEGPWISSVDGYRGAHPIEHARDPDLDEFDAWQEAACGRVRLVTLAPERRGGIEAIRALVARGVVVAIGHTAADGETIRETQFAGATLCTHLGNGIASPLPRHPNPIIHQAVADGLVGSFIADGHHLDDDTLKMLVRAKGIGRTILVSDASPLAGLPVGTYGEWAVDPSGKVVVAGTPYLAGSNQGLDVGLTTLRRVTGLPLRILLETVLGRPAQVVGARLPPIREGQLAELVVVGEDEDGRVKVEPWPRLER
jgi:N-acetylglucosamine-6-phosphate deacetylase